MFEISVTARGNKAGHYIVKDDATRIKDLDFELFKRAFGGRRITSPEDLARFENVPSGYLIWETAHGYIKCIKP